MSQAEAAQAGLTVADDQTFVAGSRSTVDGMGAETLLVKPDADLDHQGELAVGDEVVHVGRQVSLDLKAGRAVPPPLPTKPNRGEPLPFEVLAPYPSLVQLHKAGIPVTQADMDYWGNHEPSDFAGIMNRTRLTPPNVVTRDQPSLADLAADDNPILDEDDLAMVTSLDGTDDGMDATVDVDLAVANAPQTLEDQRIASLPSRSEILVLDNQTMAQILKDHQRVGERLGHTFGTRRLTEGLMSGDTGCIADLMDQRYERSGGDPELYIGPLAQSEVAARALVRFVEAHPEAGWGDAFDANFIKEHPDSRMAQLWRFSRNGYRFGAFRSAIRQMGEGDLIDVPTHLIGRSSSRYDLADLKLIIEKGHHALARAVKKLWYGLKSGKVRPCQEDMAWVVDNMDQILAEGGLYGAAILYELQLQGLLKYPVETLDLLAEAPDSPHAHYFRDCASYGRMLLDDESRVRGMVGMDQLPGREGAATIIRDSAEFDLSGLQPEKDQLDVSDVGALEAAVGFEALYRLACQFGGGVDDWMVNSQFLDNLDPQHPAYILLKQAYESPHWSALRAQKNPRSKPSRERSAVTWFGRKRSSKVA